MSLPISKRKAALVDLKERLSFIQVAKGYNTDAGLNIEMGEWPRSGEDDPLAAIAVTVDDDRPQPTTGSRAQAEVPVQVWALVPVGTADPQLAIEDIIVDIKEAVELEAQPDRTRALGTTEDGQPIGTVPKGVSRGTTLALRRREGSGFVGGGVEYVLTFEESYGGGGR